MPIIELPEFGSAQVNENVPTIALKQGGWADGDQPPASVVNWIARATYDSMRAMLGLHMSALIGTLAPDGRDFSWNTGTHNVEGFAYDPTGTYTLVAARSAAGALEFARAADQDGEFTTEGTDTGAPLVDGIAVSPGAYAVACCGAGNEFYYSAYPYTSWSNAAHVWGGVVVDFMVADIGDGHGPSLLVLTAAGSIWVTDATATPTASGDWTEYDISSVISTPVGFAIDDNGILVVIGFDSGIGGAATAWCDVANGVAAGDFSTPVDQSAGSGTAIACDGSRFVITVTGPDSIKTSDDGQNWTAIAGSGALVNNTAQRLIADPTSDFFFLFDGSTSGGTDVYASRRGISWIEIASSNDAYVDVRVGRGPAIVGQHRFMSVRGTGNTFLLGTL